MKLLRRLLIAIVLCMPVFAFAGEFSIPYTGYFESFDGISMDHKIQPTYFSDTGLYIGPEFKYYGHTDAFAYGITGGYTHAIGNSKVMPYVEIGYAWVTGKGTSSSDRQGQFEYDFGIQFPLIWGIKFQYENDQPFDHTQSSQFIKLRYDINRHVDINIGALWGQANSFGHYTTPMVGFAYTF